MAVAAAGQPGRRDRVLTAHCDASGTCRYILRPNRSLSTRGMVWFVAGVGALALFIAMRFVLLGAWMVLPLAVAEIAALGFAFFLVARSGRRCEIIDVDEREHVLDEQDRDAGQKRTDSNAFDCRAESRSHSVRKSLALLLLHRERLDR